MRFKTYSQLTSRLGSRLISWACSSDRTASNNKNWWTLRAINLQLIYATLPVTHLRRYYPPIILYLLSYAYTMKTLSPTPNNFPLFLCKSVNSLIGQLKKWFKIWITGKITERVTVKVTANITVNVTEDATAMFWYVYLGIFKGHFWDFFETFFFLVRPITENITVKIGERVGEKWVLIKPGFFGQLWSTSAKLQLTKA